MKSWPIFPEKERSFHFPPGRRAEGGGRWADLTKGQKSTWKFTMHFAKILQDIW